MSKSPQTSERLVKHQALRLVTIADLNIDRSYQRGVVRTKIASEFFPDAFGIPVVGERDDLSLWIIDGQQRTEAVKRLGWSQYRANVIKSEGPEHEAKVYCILNMKRTKLKPHEDFKALLTAQDQLAWEIREAVHSVGYKIDGTRATTDKSPKPPMTVGCIKALYLAHKKAKGVDGIKFALEVASKAWPSDSYGVINFLVLGLTTFFVRHEGVVDLDRLIPRLSLVPPQKIYARASQLALGGTKNEEVANEIERLYRRRYVKPR